MNLVYNAKKISTGSWSMRLWYVAGVLNAIGLANVLPAVMARFGQTASTRNAATVMAGFYLALFAGGLVSTWLASQFTSLPIATFWLLHALCAVAGAAGLGVQGNRAKRAVILPDG